MKRKEKSVYKIVVLGAKGVGRLTFLQKIVRDQPEYIQVRRFILRRKIKLGKSEVTDYRQTLGIAIATWKMGYNRGIYSYLIYGLEYELFFKRVLKEYLRGTEGAFLLFDLTKPSTLEYLTNIVIELKESCGDIRIIILGNKADLVQENHSTEDDALSRFSKYGIKHFIKISAKNNFNIYYAMEKMASILPERE